MTINASDFRQYVINPALAVLVPVGIPVSKTAADLLMATAAMESDLGTWLTQVGGPALGPFQIEPASLADLMARMSRSEALALASVASPKSPAVQIETNLLYAAVVCRLFYWHKPFAMPATSTITSLWDIYKTYYNTPLGAATMMGFVTALKLTDISF